MVRRRKVTISLASDRLAELDSIVVARDSNRSALIEEAIDAWCNARMARELADGYRAMAEDDRKTAEDDLGSGIEALD